MSAPVRATFVMEQHLGHLSYYHNLRQSVSGDDRLTATWVEVDYDPTTTIASRIPGLPDGLRGPLAGRHQILDGLESSQPDVAFFNTQVPAVLGATRLRKLPYVVATDITPRQYDRMADHYGHEADGGGPISAAKHAVNVQVFNRAGRVVCWSSWCAESVIAEYGVAQDRVEVIAPGVDLEIWKPSADEQPGSRPRILFVGGDLHRKGGTLLVDAFERLPAGSAELHLVTRTDYRPESNGIIVHRDMSPNSAELVELFRSSDIFVLPSGAEAFGIAAVEASACGLPVIASRSGGLTDIVLDGVNGFAVAPVGVDELTDRLRLLVTDPDRRRRMGAAARSRAEERFDAAANGRRVVELLVELADGQPCGR